VPEPKRVAIVTGGASGIGFAIVRHLSAAGMAVVAMDNDASAVAFAEESRSPKEDTLFIRGDAGCEADIIGMVHMAVDAFGRIDHLCNNAAFHPFEMIEDHAMESWRETFRVNVDGTMLSSQEVLPHLRLSDCASIVNIGSISGSSPYAGGGAYATSKAAIAMLTRVLALEFGPYGVTVNCISPGSIRHRPGSDLNAQPPPSIPIARYGTVRDVAEMVGFLASNASRYITGSNIILDGGATAGRIREGRAVTRTPQNGES
jgi:NAD(P)-dependent dehydrogenase (short-subunit alcohol dehydrogenase family)